VVHRPGLAALLALAALLGVAHAGDAVSSEVPKGVTAESLGSFKVTYYWVTCEDDAKGERDTELLDPDGKSLGKFRADFAKNLKLEGTGRTLEGKTLNTAGKGRYHFVKHPWGTGAKGVGLTPFRSLAVDPKVIPIGTKILIAEAVGALLPDGSTHDGIFTAEDTGGAIKGQHVDLFCGLKRDWHILTKRGIEEKGVTLHKVTKDERKPVAVTFPRTGTVRFAEVAVRGEKDEDSASSASLKEGDKVKVVASDGAWLELEGKKRFVEAAAIDLRP
jgi:3D (Asp-Asp-Asp) domain-containing protein